jgi:hypothetical protein
VCPDNKERMKVLLALAPALFLLSGISYGQVALVHVTSCGPGIFPGTNCTIPATSGGNLIVMGWQAGGMSTSTNIISVTDNAGNNYSEAGAAKSIDAATRSVVDIWYTSNSVGGATSLTVTPSAQVANGAVTIWEFSGLVSGVNPLEAVATLSSQPATLSPVGAPVTTSGAGDLIISLAAVSGNAAGIMTGNSFSTDSKLRGSGWAHLITASAGTYQAAWTKSSSGTYASSTVAFRASVPGGGPCDINQDGQVNAADVQLIADMSLNLMACTANIQGAGICDANVVQEVVNSALGGSCPVSSLQLHTAALAWTESTSTSLAGYNVYRGTVPGGPYVKVNSSLVAGSSYTDTTVQPGQTYYYVSTAVEVTGDESAYSNQMKAVIP